MPAPRILSVGHCGFDGPQIAAFLGREFGAEVLEADRMAEALEALKHSRFDLVLVNRINHSDGSHGLDLIRAVRSDPALADLPVMLISNYPEAQQQAVAAGASPGFGKAELNTPRAVEAVAAALSASGRQPAQKTSASPT
jgi:two-component system chemotaxis response regulator CheY